MFKPYLFLTFLLFPLLVFARTTTEKYPYITTQMNGNGQVGCGIGYRYNVRNPFDSLLLIGLDTTIEGTPNSSVQGRAQMIFSGQAPSRNWEDTLNFNNIYVGVGACFSYHRPFYVKSISTYDFEASPLVSLGYQRESYTGNHFFSEIDLILFDSVSTGSLFPIPYPEFRIGLGF